MIATENTTQHPKAPPKQQHLPLSRIKCTFVGSPEPRTGATEVEVSPLGWGTSPLTVTKNCYLSTNQRDQKRRICAFLALSLVSVSRRLGDPDFFLKISQSWPMFQPYVAVLSSNTSQAFMRHLTNIVGHLK